MISGEMKGIADPVEQRYLRVGVPPADHEDGRVKRDEDVDQGGEREAAARRQQEGDGDDHREDLEHPRQAVLGGPSGPDEHKSHARQKDGPRTVAFQHARLRRSFLRRERGELP